MIEQRPGTHILKFEIPLDLHANDAASGVEIEYAFREVVTTILPLIKLGTLGLICDQVTVSMAETIDPDGL